MSVSQKSGVKIRKLPIFSAVATKVVNIFCFGSAGYFFNVKEVPDVPTDGSGELGETNKSYENEKQETTKESSQSADL